MKRLVLAMTLGLLVTCASGALAIGKGTSMLAIQLFNGTADLYTPTPPPAMAGYITAYDHSEIGVQLQYWNMMSDDYAFAISGGIGFFSEENEPGQGVLPGSPTQKYSQNSINVRIGGDRVVKVGDRAILYFGPGFEYWSGTSTFDDVFVAGSLESESVTRLSLDGRIGATMLIGPTWGFTMAAGHKIGMASAEEDGAKASWWPSSNYGNGGLIFLFGGAK